MRKDDGISGRSSCERQKTSVPRCPSRRTTVDYWNYGCGCASAVAWTISAYMHPRAKEYQLFNTANLIAGIFNLFQYVNPLVVHFINQYSQQSSVAPEGPADQQPLVAEVAEEEN